MFYIGLAVQHDISLISASAGSRPEQALLAAAAAASSASLRSHVFGGTLRWLPSFLPSHKKANHSLNIALVGTGDYLK